MLQLNFFRRISGIEYFLKYITKLHNLQSQMIYNQGIFTRNNVRKTRHQKKNRKLCQPKQNSIENFDTQFFIKGKSIQINKINCPLPISDSQNIQNIDNTVEVPSEKQSENQNLKLENQKRKNKFRVKKLAFTYLNSKNTTLDKNLISNGQKNHGQFLSNHFYFNSNDPSFDHNIIQIGQKKDQQISSSSYPSQQNSSNLLKSKSESKNNLETSLSPQNSFKFTRNSIKMITCFNHNKQDSLIGQEDQEIDNKIQRKKQQQQQYFSINYSEDQQKQTFISGQLSNTIGNETNEPNGEIFTKQIELENLDQSLCMQLLNYVLKRNHLDIFCIKFGWFRRMKEVRLYQLKQFLYLHPKHTDIFPIIYQYESILQSYSKNYVKYLSNQMRNLLD